MPFNELWGFDHHPPLDQGWSGDLTYIGRSTSPVRTGTHAQYLDYSGSVIKTPTFANQSTIYLGVALYRTNTNATGVICLYDGSTEQITVKIESTGALTVRRGGASGTTLATSSTGLFTANAWHHLQLSVVFHGSTGSVELRLNSVAVASASGVNTSASGNNYCNVAGFYSDSYRTGIIDDLWLTDSGFKGDCAIETLYPSADGTTNNFTASTGSRYACCDETGDDNGDTDYVSSSTLNDIQLFAMGNLAATTGTIAMVKFTQTTRKDDAGARSVATVVRSGGSNSIRSDNSLTTSYAVLSEVLTADPTDSAAWTITKVNALEVGVKITV